MLNDKGPLMFINTTTIIENGKEQTEYDSRYSKKNIKKELNDNETFEGRKINNIIEMYQKGRPVLCSIIINDEEVVGVPFEKSISSIKVRLENNKIIELKFEDIAQLNIIRF